MPIDKAIYSAPQGIDELAEQESPIEIEIEAPTDGALVVLEEEIEISDDFGVNLAEYLTESELTQISGDLIGEFCLLYTSPSPRDRTRSRMPSSA